MLLKCFPRAQKRCLRFQEEVDAHMKLRHPHIIRIVDAFAMEQHIVLVYASGDGERLETVVRYACKACCLRRSQAACVLRCSQTEHDLTLLHRRPWCRLLSGLLPFAEGGHAKRLFCQLLQCLRFWKSNPCVRWRPLCSVLTALPAATGERVAWTRSTPSGCSASCSALWSTFTPSPSCTGEPHHMRWHSKTVSAWADCQAISMSLTPSDVKNLQLST